ncbi:lob domain-containing protein [Musa troglodytarum]|uniref:Lob domain-containing protein n=1 Tax=Musa troglodytarum TaxID=320322 RepID=A0A9E7E9R6_9LILI|nr:lob domain-containing protein [Musa troglodytarum]
MRKSCNGCRVLRKGCSDGCTIRPCLQWIKNPEAQANATAFLAKFYGRAGLVNLINAGTEHLRPAIFRSLLFEACGRIVNPVYGSVGLLWSGSWQLCQAAVEAVLQGAPIIQISSDSAAGSIPAFKAHDIRHVSKNLSAGGVPGDLHKVACKSRTRFKRSARSPAALVVSKPGLFRRAASHETEENDSREGGSALSAVTAERSHVIQGEPKGVRLDLRLGLEPENRTGGRGAEANVEARPVGPRLSLAA